MEWRKGPEMAALSRDTGMCLCDLEGKSSCTCVNRLSEPTGPVTRLLRPPMYSGLQLRQQGPAGKSSAILNCPEDMFGTFSQHGLPHPLLSQQAPRHK